VAGGDSGPGARALVFGRLLSPSRGWAVSIDRRVWRVEAGRDLPEGVERCQGNESGNRDGPDHGGWRSRKSADDGSDVPAVITDKPKS